MLTRPFSIETKNALTATQKIIDELNKRDLNDKIVLLRIYGDLEQGKNSDVKFPQIEQHAKNKGAYFVLKNTHDLNTREVEIKLEIEKSENVEEQSIKSYSAENPSDFNSLIPQLINSLDLEKKEDEKTEIFNNRVLEEAKKILRL